MAYNLLIAIALVVLQMKPSTGVMVRGGASFAGWQAATEFLQSGGFNASEGNGLSHSVVANASASEQKATMFVAVMMSLDSSADQRASARYMWKNVEGQSMSICARFVFCGKEPITLQAEEREFRDLLFLDCEEGYTRGLLTKKVMMAMQAYVDDKVPGCEGRDVFMKTDVDTYVRGHWFRKGLADVNRVELQRTYAGVPEALDLKPYPGFVVRDPLSDWYEPYSVYPYEKYPYTFLGGPGYVLGRNAIKAIFKRKIAQGNILSCEDRAVAVWIHDLKMYSADDAQITEMQIPGTNGMKWDNPVLTGSWQNYPYALHHHLSAQSIRCLTDMDIKDDPNARIDTCMQMTSDDALYKFRAPS